MTFKTCIQFAWGALTKGGIEKDQTLGITSEIVEPFTRFLPPNPRQAVWIVTAILIRPYFALVHDIGAP